MAKESDNKKSFMLYFDYRKHLQILTDEQRGKLLMALMDYGETHKEPELDGAALMAFSFIACQMDRDAEKYAAKCKKRSEAGKQGGRPPKATESNENQTKAKKANGFSEKQTKAKKPDTDKDKDTDTDVSVITDTSSPSIPPQGETPDGVPAEAAEQTPYKAIADMYHEICKSYPKLRSVSEQRKRAIAARWKEYGGDLDTFRELFTLAEASAFLKGRNPRNWTADFNWLMNSENMAKVLEGNYNGTEKPQNGGMNHGNHGGNIERRETTARDPAPATLSGFRMADD